MSTLMIRHWSLVLAILLAMLAGSSAAVGFVHPKMSYLFSSADSDDLASSWLTSDTALLRSESDVIQQPEQRWIKPSPKALRVGDSCSKEEDCSLVSYSQCDLTKGVCLCSQDHPVDGGTLCGQGRQLNESCTFSGQCVDSDRNMECRDHVCQCTYDFKPTFYIGGNIVCTSTSVADGVGSYVDPTMIGVLIGLVLMFVIMCVVLRLFSKARWRENRTIFNTPNPRLANASLLKEVTSKQQQQQQQPGSRRGSLTKNGSRQPSLASIPRSLDASVSTGHSVSRRPSLSRYAATATVATCTDKEASATETDKLLDQHQISVQVDQAVSAV